VGDTLKISSLTAALCTCLAFAQAHPPAGTSIVHVTIINVATGAKLPDQTVMIDDSRIVAIRPTRG
jgi:translation elongation factor P/translation initiation factor 5A